MTIVNPVHDNHMTIVNPVHNNYMAGLLTEAAEGRHSWELLVVNKLWDLILRNMGHVDRE